MRSGRTGCSALCKVSRPCTHSVERADALDPPAHPHEAVGEIGDFGLARRVLDQALAAGKHRGHERVVGCADRDLRQFDAAAGQTPRGARIDVAAVEIDLGAERFQRGEVEIDGARSDRAAAGQRNARLPQRATSGASTQKLARMRATIS